MAITMIQTYWKSDNIPESGEKLPTCWKMHRSTSQPILLHRRAFRTSHRRCAASQRVAGPHAGGAGSPTGANLA